MGGASTTASSGSRPASKLELNTVPESDNLYIQLSARLPRPEVREEVCQLRPGRAPDERQVSDVSPGYRPLSLPLVTVGLVEKQILYCHAFIL